MLIESGLAIGAYVGIRIYEEVGKHKHARVLSKRASAKRTSPDEPHKISKKDSMIRGKQQLTFAEKDKKADHYLMAGTVHIVIAGLRQFAFPALAPVYLGLFIYVNIPLFRKAEKVIWEDKKVGKDLLNAIANTTALALGQYFAIGISRIFYFVGDKVILQSEKHTKKMLSSAFENLPQTVRCIVNGSEVEISLEDVRNQDIVVVSIGEVIPIDGTIIEGMAMIDQHSLTGEAQPAEKEAGDPVYASTVLIRGKILIKTEKTGQQTTVSKIDEILSSSANFKSQEHVWGERFADKGATSFLAMYLLTSLMMGPQVAIVVITAHFGTRIRILAPLGTYTHLKLAHKRGALVKHGIAMERLMHVDTVLFDKTGTLTETIPGVGDIICCEQFDKNKILQLAAAAECKMSHPIAQAIVAEAESSSLTIPDVDDSEYLVGYGVLVHIEDQVVQVGSSRYIRSEGIAIPDKVENALESGHARGYSFVMVAVDGVLIGAIEIRTIVRAEVKQLIRGLRDHGIKHIAIVSGDHKMPTKILANELGMDRYFHDVLPEEKSSIVEQLQNEGDSVCFIGDGVNDAIAMQKANVSISLTGASSIATDVSDIILLDGTLHHLIDVFEISKKLKRNLKTSFALTMAPSFINLSGAFALSFCFTTAIVIKNMFFFVGLGNAVLPMKDITKKALVADGDGRRKSPIKQVEEGDGQQKSPIRQLESSA